MSEAKESKRSETSTSSPSFSLEEVEHWRAISAANLSDMWNSLAPASGQRSARWNGVSATDNHSPAPYPNSAAMHAALDDAHAAETVARLRTFYAGGEGGPWMLWSPWPTPDLSPYGVHLVGHPPLMVRPVGGQLPAPPAALTIAEVTDDEGLVAFEQVLVDGFPAPELQPAGSRRVFDPRILGGRLRLWVGRVAREPVSVAAAYIGERAVGIYMVATLPTERGKGYAAALTLQAVRAAPTLPAELQASDAGQPVYLRLGFQIVTPYTVWTGSRSTASS